jgi:putative acetyltransferase
MIQLKRVDSKDPDFMGLVKRLDAELTEMDGRDHDYYNQFNKIDRIKHALVLYEDHRPIACGAMKLFSPGVMEIKRMFTLPESRGRGVASRVLKELESWALELSFTKCVLETGKRQPRAIELYQKRGYHRIPNYGPYAGIENSICFEKELSE